MKKPLIIGITGGIGGGKSTFSNYLRQKGELVYDTDLKAKYLQENDKELIRKIKTKFGEDIYVDNKLDRKRLARIVFSDAEKLKTLNSIVHPAVIDDFQKWIRSNSDRKFLFMECAILFEGSFDRLVDRILVVTAPEPVRIKRVILRDRLTEDQVLARMKNQISEEEKINRADWVFETNENEFATYEADEFLEMIYQMPY
jgi:dephospho-CoA kinase